MKKRKIPLRMCVVCREMKNKKDLIRVVKNSDGKIFVDNTGKKNGRGAYVCNSENCIEQSEKRKVLSREFKTAVDLAIYSELKAEKKQEDEN